MSLFERSRDIRARVSQAQQVEKNEELRQRLSRYGREIVGETEKIERAVEGLKALHDRSIDANPPPIPKLGDAEDRVTRAREAAGANLLAYAESGVHGEMLVSVRLVAEHAEKAPNAFWGEFVERTRQDCRGWGVLGRTAQRVAQFRASGKALSDASLVLQVPAPPTPEKIERFLRAREVGERAAKELEGAFDEAILSLMRRMSAEDGVPIDEVPSHFWDWVGQHDARGDVRVRMGLDG